MPTLAQQHNHDFKEGSFEVFENGKLTYFENSLGYWFTHKFDSKGREIYYENSNNFWYKYEYDSNGNVSSTKEWSRGDYHERKFEYDSNGNKITEDSLFEGCEDPWGETFEWRKKTTYDSNGQVLHCEESESLNKSFEQSNILNRKGIYNFEDGSLSILLGGLLLIGIVLFAGYCS